jgi:hypothetical protein
MNLSKVEVIESYHTLRVSVELTGHATASLSLLAVVSNGKLKRGSVRVQNADEKAFYRLDEKLQHKIILAVTEKFSLSLNKEVYDPVFKIGDINEAFLKLKKQLAGQ